MPEISFGRQQQANPRSTGRDDHDGNRLTPINASHIGARLHLCTEVLADGRDRLEPAILHGAHLHASVQLRHIEHYPPSDTSS